VSAGRLADDAAWMKLAIAEAKKGLGATHPNPTVGALIVANGEMVGAGFHHRVGAAHAEINALKMAGDKAKGATLYCTLEPCSHFGRTPPCTQAIVEAHIRRVVFASSDPNPLVNGAGERILRKHKVAVVKHVLKDEADALNRPFLKWIQTGLPWVTLKAALTLDGKIALQNGESQWITADAARAQVHLLRRQVDALLVGVNTVQLDNPRLSARLANEKPAKKQPVRVVLDVQGRLAKKARLLAEPGRIIQLTEPGRRPVTSRVEHWTMPTKHGHFSPKDLLQKIGATGLLHLLIEGGAGINASFLREGQVDELLLFMAPKLVGHSGLTWSGNYSGTLEDTPFVFESSQRVGPDLCLRLLKSAAASKPSRSSG
jgi:diaminohydroxyphosphoribosylaminopyrimidine deaminase / 5-amino-6-(5-phosphoribosylamino)uracil reductase